MAQQNPYVQNYTPAAPMQAEGSVYYNNHAAQQSYIPAAPPGTLGRTYYRTSREIPAKKPPRVGMIDVQFNNPDAKISVYNTHPFREEDSLEGRKNKKHPNHWIFESKPLVPGIPHIYRVESQDPSGAVQVKYIRLVPGRIVDLQF